MGSETFWLGGLGVLIGIALIVLLVLLGWTLDRQRRRVLQGAAANQCPSCRRLGVLKAAGRERIPGTLRQVTVQGEEKPAWVARYRVLRRCPFCGALQAEEEEGPAEPSVSGTVGEQPSR